MVVGVDWHALVIQDNFLTHASPSMTSRSASAGKQEQGRLVANASAHTLRSSCLYFPGRGAVQFRRGGSIRGRNVAWVPVHGSPTKSTAASCVGECESLCMRCVSCCASFRGRFRPLGGEGSSTATGELEEPASSAANAGAPSAAACPPYAKRDRSIYI